MPEVEDDAARLVVASPPFTNRPDGKTLDKGEYLRFIEKVFREALRVLAPAGYLVCVNTDLRDHARYNGGDARFDGALWQKHCDLRRAAEGLGFRCVETKVWAKTLKRDVYRYTFAYVQFFQKPGVGGGRTLRKGVAADFAPDVWLLEKGTTRRDSRGRVFRDAIHPSLVRRCVGQLTAPGDLVVSPFAGSGTILSVSKLMGRRCVGYELNADLKTLIEESVETPERFPAYRECLQ